MEEILWSVPARFPLLAYLLVPLHLISEGYSKFQNAHGVRDDLWIPTPRYGLCRPVPICNPGRGPC